MFGKQQACLALEFGHTGHFQEHLDAVIILAKLQIGAPQAHFDGVNVFFRRIHLQIILKGRRRLREITQIEPASPFHEDHWRKGLVHLGLDEVHFLQGFFELAILHQPKAFFIGLGHRRLQIRRSGINAGLGRGGWRRGCRRGGWLGGLGVTAAAKSEHPDSANQLLHHTRKIRASTGHLDPQGEAV